MIALILLPILTGGIIVHLIWPDRDIKILVFKAFLGIGIGLGISSLLYFIYLLGFANRHWFIVIQLVLFILLLAVTIWVERKRGWNFLPHWSFRDLTRTQGI